MTTKYLLTHERKAAERALYLEELRTAVQRGRYIPTREERTADFWEYTMTHNCSNKGAEIRNHRAHVLNERLDRIAFEFTWLSFISASRADTPNPRDLQHYKELTGVI